MSESRNLNTTPQAIEAARQEAWERRGDFAAPEPAEGKARVYVKPSSPFTSGNLHMGHVRDYSIGDAYARFRRARGDAVLFGFGFDAFGLPAELAAIERQEPPAEWVAECGERMLGQMKRLGFSFDYDRVFYSSDEGQYRWSQWLFLTLLERGPDLPRRRHRRLVRHLPDHARLDPGRGRALLALPQRGAADPAPDLVPAHHPLPGGERPQHRAARREPWDELSLATQRYILGRSDGVEVDLEGGDGRSLTVFTPHRERASLASFVLLSPRHPEVDAWAPDSAVREELERMRSGGWDRSARDARSVPLVDTGTSVAGARRRASCRSSSRRSSMPASAPPRRSASPPSTRPTAISPSGSSGSRRRTAEERGGGARAGAGRGRPRGEPLPRQRLLDLAPALLGHADPGRPLRGVRPGAGARGGPAGASSRATSSRPARGTRWPSAPTSSTSSAPSAAPPPSARPTPSTATSTRSGSGSRRRSRPRTATSRCSTHPDLQEWLPVRAAGRRQRQRRLRLRPARRHQGAARHRALRLHRGRRAVRRLPLPRDGDRRRAAR